MTDESKHVVRRATSASDTPGMPVVVDRAAFQAELDRLRVGRRRTPGKATRLQPPAGGCRWSRSMVPHRLIGERGPVTLLDVFEGRRQFMAYYFMWYTGQPAAEQCEGCTWYTSQVRELSYLHSRDVTFTVFCQGPYEESARYRDFMGWEMPWYSAQDSLDTLLVGRRVGMFHLVCYVRQGSNVFETCWTNGRGVEAMDNSYRLLDLTVYGRQEKWEDSPTGWPQRSKRQPSLPYRWTSHRPMAPPEGPGIRATWELAGAVRRRDEYEH